MYIETASMATNNTNANLGPILPDPPLHQEEPVHWWFDGLNLIMLLNIVVVLLSLITAGCLWFGIKTAKNFIDLKENMMSRTTGGGTPLPIINH